MEKLTMSRLNYGDIVEWTGNEPDTFEVISIVTGDPIMSSDYAYEDWMWRLKSLSDGHEELIDGGEMENIHFIKKYEERY